MIIRGHAWRASCKNKLIMQEVSAMVEMALFTSQMGMWCVEVQDTALSSVK